MANSATTFHGPETEEAFLADRQRFWFGFTKAVTYAVAALVLFLVLMTVFLV